MNLKINIIGLKLAMLRKGYSVTKLSKQSGLSKSTISNVINKENVVRYETIYKIAKCLDINVEDLVIEIK